jgi:hypothetical protein
VRRGRKATGLRREDSRAAEGNAQAFFLLPGFLFFRLQRATGFNLKSNEWLSVAADLCLTENNYEA